MSILLQQEEIVTKDQLEKAHEEFRERERKEAANSFWLLMIRWFLRK